MSILSDIRSTPSDSQHNITLQRIVDSAKRTDNHGLTETCPICAIGRAAYD